MARMVVRVPDYWALQPLRVVSTALRGEIIWRRTCHLGLILYLYLQENRPTNPSLQIIGSVIPASRPVYNSPPHPFTHLPCLHTSPFVHIFSSFCFHFHIFTSLSYGSNGSGVLMLYSIIPYLAMLPVKRFTFLLYFCASTPFTAIFQLFFFFSLP